jgi:hypothetical protein
VVTKGTGGTVAVANSAGTAAGGWLNVPTAASANDYQSIASQVKIFEFLAGKPLAAEARVLVTESGSNTSSWYFGLTDTLTTGFLTNAGAPPSSFIGAVIYKPTGSTDLKLVVSNGSTQTITKIGTFTSGTSLLLSILFNPNDGVTGFIKPEINSQADLNLVPIQPTPIAFSGVAPMYLSAGIKAVGSAAETISLDYWGVDVYRI